MNGNSLIQLISNLMKLQVTKILTNCKTYNNASYDGVILRCYPKVIQKGFSLRSPTEAMLWAIKASRLKPIFFFLLLLFTNHKSRFSFFCNPLLRYTSYLKHLTLFKHLEDYSYNLVTFPKDP